MMIVVDWGTSNLRAWLVDDSGQVLSQYASELGLLAASEVGFSQVFDQVVHRLDADPSRPAILFGMVGSKKGWLEVPYAPTPADVGSIANSARAVPDRPNTWIVGGVCHDFDGKSPEVMRGEEVQAIGVLNLQPGAEWVCLPGTHTKWVRVEDGRVISFKTYMTGELFNLVTKHSILATQIDAKGFDRDGFTNGLALAEEPGALTQALFQLRTRYLAGRVSSQQVFSMASGLLIGTEFITERPPAGQDLVICGSTVLAGAYRIACEYFGLDCVTIDPEQAAIAGILTLSPLIKHAKQQ